MKFSGRGKYIIGSNYLRDKELGVIHLLFTIDNLLFGIKKLEFTGEGGIFRITLSKTMG